MQPALAGPVAITAVALLAGLSVLGHVAGQDRPLAAVEAHVSGEGIDPIQGPPSDDSPRGRFDVRRDAVTIALKGQRVEATVMSPDAPGPHPAVALVHGAGGGTRGALADQAEAFASAGMVALVADKRTVNYSFANRDFELLAEDALATVEVLRRREEVDPDRVGLWGISEGAAWVLPLAARRDPDVAFLVLVSGPMMTPLEQSQWVVDSGLRRARAPRGVRKAAARFLARGRWDYVHHDALPVLEKVRQPVLGLFGEHDGAMPAPDCARTLVETLRRGATVSHAVHLFPDADHGLRLPGGDYAPGYLDTMTAWMLEHSAPERAASDAGPPGEPAGAGAAEEPGEGEEETAEAGTADEGDRSPAQATEADHDRGPAEAVSLESPPWYHRVAAEATAYGAAALALALSAIARRRLRRDRRGQAQEWESAHGALRRLRRWSVGTVVGVHAVILSGAAMAIAGLALPWAVTAGWLAVRIAAVVTVGLLALSAHEVALAGRARRPTGTQAVAAAGSLVAPAVLLVVAAYWGVFAAGW